MFEFSAFVAGFAAPASGRILPRVRYTKNGGMRFLRIGRLQFSFCICKKGI